MLRQRACDLAKCKQRMRAHSSNRPDLAHRTAALPEAQTVSEPVPDTHLKLWPHSEMQWASSIQTRGSGRRGARAARRLLLPTRSGDTYSTRTLPSCTLWHTHLQTA